MHSDNVEVRLIRPAAVATAVILILIPFHAILTVWLSSLIGHYVVLRLWKEYILVLLTLVATYEFLVDTRFRKELMRWRLLWLIAAYLLLQLTWGFGAYLLHTVSKEALAYGLLVNSRYLVFFFDVLVIASKAPRLQNGWVKFIFWPAALVSSFALLQYFVLPYDFLRHLGYSSSTIFPYEDINSNMHYIRVMSTLRGSNPLGAYLIIILSLLVVFWLYREQKLLKQQFRTRVGVFSLGVLTICALVLTFSRASWLGAIVSIVLAILLSVRSPRVRLVLLSIGVAGMLVIATLLFTLRHDTTFQNIVFHTQEHSAVATTSDQGHTSALQSGIHDVIHEPLGRGPGTAGPASVYNSESSARIAENYFLQVGQEVGWLGLSLFMAINTVIAYMLWCRRARVLALGVLVALIGISIASLFSHTWTDDTLAYLWWGLAALALVPVQTGVDGSDNKH